jgi:hypothetical protein
MFSFLKVGTLLVVGLVLLASCTILPIQGMTGSGTLVTTEHDLDGFTRVDAGSAFQVTITRGNDFAVTVTSDDNIADRLQVEVRGDTLVLGMRQPTMMLGNVTLRAEVTMPVLEGVNFSGATHGRFTGFRLDGEFRGEASGASTLTGDIEAGDMRLAASGASNMTLMGSAADVDVKASGASRVDLSSLSARNVRAEASGASTVRVNLSGELNASASGASNVKYTGSPTRVRENTSGASSVAQDN